MRAGKHEIDGAPSLSACDVAFSDIHRREAARLAARDGNHARAHRVTQVAPCPVLDARCAYRLSQSSRRACRLGLGPWKDKWKGKEVAEMKDTYFTA